MKIKNAYLDNYRCNNNSNIIIKNKNHVKYINKSVLHNQKMINLIQENKGE